MPQDWVFITAGGKRWHSRENCELLIKGQKEAEDKGLGTHPIQTVSPPQAEGREPCTHCVKLPTIQIPRPTAPQTSYESVFLDDILGRLPELTGWVIKPQEKVTVAGRSYVIDFGLTHPNGRIAVEVDGADKGSNAPTHDQWTARQNALVRGGWDVLRFTNRQVMHEQEQCRREIAVKISAIEARPSHQPALTSTTPAKAPASNAGWIAAGVAAVVAVVVGIAFAVSGGDGRRGSTETVNTQPSEPASDTTQTGGGIDPVRQPNGFLLCPSSHAIKGNITESGDRIYHRPGGNSYNKVKPEKCFATDAEARGSGYRPSSS